MHLIYLSLILVVFTSQIATTWAQETKMKYETIKDIYYYQDMAGDEQDSYQLERCRLDLYRPTNAKGYPTVVWFHGGGLTGGGKSIHQEFMGQGMAVAAVNYRFSPKVKSPVYIEDSAAAIAWVVKNIAKYDGDASKVFVTGHSAGGYLTLINGLDKKYLGKHGVDADSIAAYLPLSGQVDTHSAIRAERGIPRINTVVDELAPLYQIRPNCAPFILVTGDRNMELWGRYESNAWFVNLMKRAGNENITLYEIQGFNHGTVRGPACELVARYIKSLTQK
ncbi:MAG: alpha/beta hydrolase [Phycisphaerales bacterium]|nr:alpha/beta hydrolase [Phycisphaerales bacterium]